MAIELNYKSLLDYWTPPEIFASDGSLQVMEPVSFLCSSFTFDTEFFEEECLTRFLMMETEKENDGVAYLVELEERLAGLTCGLVLVDQHHCKGSRNLRWDLGSCRVKNGIQHSKIVLLQWSHCIRIIIGSANLTRPGYCMNQEVFGSFDYVEGCKTDPQLLHQLLGFLQELTEATCGDTIQQKLKNAGDKLTKQIKHFKPDTASIPQSAIASQLLFISPNQKDGLTRLRKIWDDNFYGPPDVAYITSPFFDETESANSPTNNIFNILKQKGEATVKYHLATDFSNESDEVVLQAPAFLDKKPRPSCETRFYGLAVKGVNESGKIVPRPLHKKSIWLESATADQYMIGSSNFTSAALGLGFRANYETNIVYSVDRQKSPGAYKMLSASFIEGIDLKGKKLRFHQVPNEDEYTADIETVLLPSYFGEAILKKNDSGPFLELNFYADRVSDNFDFSITLEQSGVSGKLFDSDKWQAMGCACQVIVPLDCKKYPDFLLVHLREALPAYWPVLAESQEVLTPLENLQNLSLNTLIQILSSTQPLHRLLKKLHGFVDIKSQETIQINNDPLKLVNTTGFILQRTRRVSQAFRAMVARLSKPVYTEPGLNWRLYGPIGLAALVNAINSDAHSEEERIFLLSELALELANVHPDEKEHALSPLVVRSAIKKAATDLLNPGIKEPSTALEKYCCDAFKTALNEF